MRRLVKLQSMRLGLPIADVARQVWARLQAAVAKGTANMLTRAYPMVFNPNHPRNLLDTPSTAAGLAGGPVNNA